MVQNLAFLRLVESSIEGERALYSLEAVNDLSNNDMMLVFPHPEGPTIAANCPFSI